MRDRILLSLSLALLASGCDRKAEGQTVAIVNGEEITASELNAELNSMNVPSGADKDVVRSRLLQAMIDRRLLVQQAREEGLDKSPEFLNQQRRMTEALLVNMLVSRKLNTAQLPSAAEISRFQAERPGMFARREMWNLEQVQFETSKNPQVTAQLAAANSLDEVVGVLTANKIPFVRGKSRIDTAQLPPELHRRIIALPEGEPFIIPQGDRSVANTIVARAPAPLPADQAKTAAVNGLRRATGVGFVQDRVKALRQSAKIEYQPGYAPKPPAAAAKPAATPR